jgi:hypothetical protein
MDGSPSLARLFQRVQESNARLARVRPLLPAALQSQVRAGPVDEAGWSLLASNAAVAAKLRHLLPLIDKALREAGWAPTAFRIKVQPPLAG